MAPVLKDFMIYEGRQGELAFEYSLFHPKITKASGTSQKDSMLEGSTRSIWSQKNKTQGPFLPLIGYEIFSNSLIFLIVKIFYNKLIHTFKIWKNHSFITLSEY